MNRFILDGRYGDLLKCYRISVAEALRKAGLPGDVFSHKTPAMKEEEYFKFMEAVGSLVTDPEMPIHIACTDKIEFFSPPIFASYCSKNGRVCIERLSRYKKLIGPMVFQIMNKSGRTEVEITTETGENELPQFLVETEFIFLVGMIRKAAREEIRPISVKMKRPVHNEAFQKFLGVPAAQADMDSIAFQNENLEKPGTFETAGRIRGGRFHKSEGKERIDSSFHIMAGCYLPAGVSKRTLQRRLSGEGTIFQKQLNHTRELLAIHYIRNTDMTTNDIVYLLGYQELNSFLRAFTAWTGTSIGGYKKQVYFLWRKSNDL